MVGAADGASTGTTPSERGYVVAVGASAGGLEALERLFDGLPADTGAAFVVIQHLSPDRKSAMCDLLASHTAMPIAIVEGPTALEPNHVYLGPAGGVLQLRDGVLSVPGTVVRASSLPIDAFFHSLAEQQGSRSVAVVLSGTGSDGTRGAVAVHAAGGLLVAQEPTNAKFDGMPRSVIATGLVDAVMPAEQIAARLVAHVRATSSAPPAMVDQAAPRTSVASPEEAVDGILQLLLRAGGIDFHEYKPATVLRRIERRMSVRQVVPIEAYHDLVLSDRAELQALRRELLIRVTSFFRDPEAFEALRREVIVPRVQRAAPGETLRVWVAGTSTGEEAYGIAMLFLRAFEDARKAPMLKVFATDVEQANVDIAGRGSYPDSIAAEVPEALLERYFQRKGATYTVKSELRQRIVFARHNLLSDPPFTRMDLVSCRNTLIYFRDDAQERAMRRLQYALLPGGCLMLGTSESIGEAQRDFTVIDPRARLFRSLGRSGGPLHSAHGVTPPMADSRGRPSSIASTGARSVRTVPDAVANGFASLLKAYAPPPSLLVNGAHELVHAYGEVEKILRVREGSASLALTSILPEALVPVAAALLFTCARESARSVADVVRVTLGDGESHALRLSAWPVLHPDGDALFMLAFEPVASTDATAAAAIDVGAETVARLHMVEGELASTRELLQSTIEQLETSNEELQATNEELMASNEEMQSSNEEMQSLNEELNTVNAENLEKLGVLERLTTDLDGLFDATGAAIVVVDAAVRLTRMSPEARRLFGFADTDLGRPFADLAPHFIDTDLATDLRATLRGGVGVQRELRAADGREYLMRVRAFPLPPALQQGAVATFIDLTALRVAAAPSSTVVAPPGSAP